MSGVLLLEKLMEVDLNMFFTGDYVLDLLCKEKNIATRINSSKIDIFVSPEKIIYLFKFLILNSYNIHKSPDRYIVQTDIYTFIFYELSGESMNNNLLFQKNVLYSSKLGFCNLDDEKIKFLIMLEKDNTLYIHSGYIYSIFKNQVELKNFIVTRQKYNKLLFDDVSEKCDYIRLINSNVYKKLCNQLRLEKY